MIAPTDNKITQAKHGKYNAVDYSARPDPVIYAPEDGVITFQGADGDCGNKLWLQGSQYRHTFCHLSAFSVAKDQKVTKGQRLGLMGNTGLSTGPHLHWVVSLGNTYIYPPTLVNETRVKGGLTVEQFNQLLGYIKGLEKQNEYRAQEIRNLLSYIQANEKLDAAQQTKLAELSKNITPLKLEDLRIVTK